MCIIRTHATWKRKYTYTQCIAILVLKSIQCYTVHKKESFDIQTDSLWRDFFFGCGYAREGVGRILSNISNIRSTETVKSGSGSNVTYKF